MNECHHSTSILSKKDCIQHFFFSTKPNELFMTQWSFHHWIGIPPVQWWRTPWQACGPLENTDWTGVRVCSQHGQLLIALNWARDSTLWYRPNLKATNTVARRVPRYAAPFCSSLLESQWTLKILLRGNFFSGPVRLKPIGAWHRDWNKFFFVTQDVKWCNFKFRLNHTTVIWSTIAALGQNEHCGNVKELFVLAQIIPRSQLRTSQESTPNTADRPIHSLGVTMVRFKQLSDFCSHLVMSMG